MVRIISGIKKGHKLFIPSAPIRPTIDRVKEALFSIINDEITDATFLDLYSGSGSVGLEAISRGAKLVVFIDNSAECIKTIKKNLGKLKIEKGHKTIRTNAFRIHKYFPDTQFDIIYIDPPYHTELQKKSLNYLIAKNMIHSKSLIIVETSSKEILPHKIEKIYLIKKNKYGDTNLYFYRVIEHPEKELQK